MTKKKSGQGKAPNTSSSTELKIDKLVTAVSKLANSATQPKKQKEKKQPSPMYSLMKAGGRVFPPLGLLADGIKAVGGFGDYTVGANTLGVQGTATDGVPQFNAPNSHRICHRECIGVLASVGQQFAVLKTLTVNPSDTDLFPWLSRIATNFVHYEIHGMIVIFESNSSEYSAQSGMGTVCIATRYDSREPAFTSMTEMQNSQFAISSKPSRNIVHPIECKRGFQPVDTYYVRRGNESATAYNYDKAKIYVASEGLNATAGTVIGRLWVTYDIELKSPALSPATVIPVGGGAYQRNSLGYSASGNNKSFVAALGNAVYDSTGSTSSSVIRVGNPTTTVNNPMVISTVNNYIRLYKKGSYVLVWNVVGVGMSTATQGETLVTLTSNGAAVGVMTRIDAAAAWSQALATYAYNVTLSADGDGINDYIQLSFSNLSNSGATTTNQSAYVIAAV